MAIRVTVTGSHSLTKVIPAQKVEIKNGAFEYQVGTIGDIEYRMEIQRISKGDITITPIDGKVSLTFNGKVRVVKKENRFTLPQHIQGAIVEAIE